MADENIGWYLLLIPFIALAVILAVLVVLGLLALLLSAGSLYGVGVSLSNYVKAFARNVRFEQAAV